MVRVFQNKATLSTAEIPDHRLKSTVAWMFFSTELLSITGILEHQPTV
jgi:hypothetical protein